MCVTPSLITNGIDSNIVIVVYTVVGSPIFLKLTRTKDTL